MFLFYRITLDPQLQTLHPIDNATHTVKNDELKSFETFQGFFLVATTSIPLQFDFHGQRWPSKVEPQTTP